MTAWVHRQFRDTRTAVATTISIAGGAGVVLGLIAVWAILYGH
jgi:hypothetical protein